MRNENLKTIAQSGVVVNIKLRGGEAKIADISSQSLPGAAKFYKDFKNPGYIAVLGKENTKLFKNIKTRVRKRLDDLSIALNGTFMLLSDYVEYRKFFEEQRVEYFNLLETVLASYDSLKESFLNETASYLNGLIPKTISQEEKEEYERRNKYILQRYEESYPSMEEIRGQFSFECNVQMISYNTPESLNVDGYLDEEEARELLDILNDSMDDSYNDIYNDIIFNMFDQAFVLGQKNALSINTAIQSGKAMKITTNKNIKYAYQRVIKSNFIQDDTLTELASKLEELLECANEDDLYQFVDQNEMFVGYVIKTAKSLGFYDNLKVDPKADEVLDLAYIESIYA